MGSLTRFKLADYIRDYDLDTLFETGTFRGDGVQYALDAGFEKVYSTEIMSELFAANRERFAGDSRVTLFHGDSPSILDENVGSLEGNVLYWLDAHYPGAEAKLLEYNDSSRADETRYPLPAELAAIKDRRDPSRDIILIDDLRMYLDGNYDFGNTPQHIDRPGHDITFIEEMFADSHHFSVLSYDHGYLLLLPKYRPPLLHLNVKLGETLRRFSRGVFGH